METPMSIIDRLRAAKGPDRELDAEIYCAVFEGFEVRHDENGAVECYLEETGAIDPPAYTGSLDAAMALRDRDNWPICVLQDLGPVMGWLARLAVFDTSEGKMNPIMHDGHHATPSIALTIAALLARGIG